MTFIILLIRDNIYLMATLILVGALFWGSVTRTIMANKGYDSEGEAVGWFLLGFLFQEYAVLFALAKKDYDTVHSLDYSKKTFLGKSTGGTEAEKRIRRRDGILRAGGWECGFCGHANNSDLKTCGCGKTKAETIEKLQVQKAQEVVAKASEVPEVKNAEIVTAETDEAKIIEMIAKYKELLDAGAITQDEYDKKKSELLGL